MARASPKGVATLAASSATGFGTCKFMDYLRCVVLSPARKAWHRNLFMRAMRGVFALLHCNAVNFTDSQAHCCLKGKRATDDTIRDCRDPDAPRPWIECRCNASSHRSDNASLSLGSDGHVLGTGSPWPDAASCPALARFRRRRVPDDGPASQDLAHQWVDV